MLETEGVLVKKGAFVDFAKLLANMEKNIRFSLMHRLLERLNITLKFETDEETGKQFLNVEKLNPTINFMQSNELALYSDWLKQRNAHLKNINEKTIMGVVRSEE